MPPTLRFFAPRSTEEPVTPAREPSVTVPAATPLTSSTAVAAMDTAPVSVPAPASASVPSLICVAPEKLFAADRFRVPAPDFVRAPAPAMLLAIVKVVPVVVSIPPPDEGADPLLFTFTPDAKRLWAKHHAALKAEIDGFNRDGDEARAGHRTKMMNYTLRLALIDALARWAEGTAFDLPRHVEEVSLTAAITLVDYFTSTADKVLFRLHDSTPVDELGGRKLKFYRALPASFTTAKAIVIGGDMAIAKRSVERYLGDKKLFQKHRDGGQYTKVHEG